MRLLTILLCALPALVLGTCPTIADGPPGVDVGGDHGRPSRGPCPLLNALANHCYLPYHGRNLTVNQTAEAFVKVFNLSAAVIAPIAAGALKAARDPASGKYDLHDLVKHNVLEHDGSLLREDWGRGGSPNGGESLVISHERYKEFISHFEGDEYVNASAAAAARYDVIQYSRKTNPKHSLDARLMAFSLIESAGYWLLMHDPKTGKVPVEWVKILLKSERLPYQEGWRTPKEVITQHAVELAIKEFAANTPPDGLPPQGFLSDDFDDQ